MRSVPKKAGVI
jgi:hypothetical protein